MPETIALTCREWMDQFLPLINTEHPIALLRDLGTSKADEILARMEILCALLESAPLVMARERGMR